eukprot:CAMPEP_0198727506 /NCGR_PEP_ID=MMETSP1475-20131203/4323_1 /TAXON_ID= ORGANISM="Unidentified sp., Strain CCMP1999" /NCGR_SAMPLE_ID=MMETSP1475 /ASSEMBLY_ACC=CAM_ASM_001111 /LENGTH=42 /DNA_ID= /DNA_START= /DNA_END= /DNA_ORIENTATION=
MSSGSSSPGVYLPDWALVSLEDCFDPPFCEDCLDSEDLDESS